MANAIGQSGGGLAALLTGAPKESFASLLDGDETVQPESKDPALLKRKQGEGGDRASQDRRHEHARNVRSSDHRVESTGIERSLVNTTVVEPPTLPSEAPRWDSKSDAQSSAVSASQSEAASGPSMEGHAVGTPAARDIAATPPLDATGEETTASRVNVVPAEEMDGSGDTSGTKIPEMIRSPRVPDWGGVGGFAAGPEGDGSVAIAQDLSVPIRSADVEAGVVEGRPGAPFMTGVVIRGVRQSG